MSSERIPLTAKGKNGEDTSSRAFSSSIATICTCVGSAVGTGNVWRFSRIVAQSSGSDGALCFLLVWVLFLFLWSMPMLLIEYALGRYTKRGIIASFLQLLGPWSMWCAAWVALVTFFILCYYTVILGWCFYYLFYTIIHPLPTNYEEASGTFYDMANSWWAVLAQFAALLLSGSIVLKDVKAIEKASLVMSPLLVIVLFFICIWSVTREGASVGIKFLFSPDWGTLKDPELWINALSQNAFDTSAGEGNFIAYAAYMTRETHVAQYAAGIPAFNNLVSLTCGISTFATAFSSILEETPNTTNAEVLEILQTSGPGSTGLTFIWMPVLFATFGTFGRVVGALFFMCLACAGASSNMSFVETCTRALEDLGLKRKFGVPALIVAAFLIGLPSALSLEFLDNQDFTWAYALLTTGLMLQAMVIIYGIHNFRTILINDYGEGDWYVPKAWGWLIKYVAPLEAVGLLAWWVLSNIIYADEDTGEKWYELRPETLMTVFLQWVVVMSVLLLLNVLAMTLRPKCWTDLLDRMPLPGVSSLDNKDAGINESELGSKSGANGDLPKEATAGETNLSFNTDDSPKAESS